MVERQQTCVLVVDDDEMVRRTVARMLRAGGYTVEEAEIAAAALAALERVPVDVVLTDIMMPGMNGCELGRAIARRWPETRVLYYSGHVFDELFESGICPKDIPFVPKPFAPDEICAHIENCLVSSPYRFDDDWSRAREA